ncbi:MAG TPA: ribonuclease H [Steroidobacteraceae bacterium]
MQKPLVHIHADESALGLQFTDRDSPGGAAGVVEFWKDHKWERRDYWISEPSTTNNRMAIRSAIEGLSALKRPCRVIFVSDSQYLVRGASEWMEGWARAGWKRKSGALENLELWQQLYDVAKRHDIEWKWVRGHAGHPQNEYANFLAMRAAKEQTHSGGLVESGFSQWLAEQREKYDKYLMFDETAPIEAPTE